MIENNELKAKLEEIRTIHPEMYDNLLQVIGELKPKFDFLNPSVVDAICIFAYLSGFQQGKVESRKILEKLEKAINNGRTTK